MPLVVDTFKAGTIEATQSITINGQPVGGDVPLGFGGGDIPSNIALGQGALSANTTGYNNIAIGTTSTAYYYSFSPPLQNNDTGYFNIAIGSGALSDNTYGGFNTAIGFGTLNYNVGGYTNTSVGFGALYYNTYGGNNVAMGYRALGNNSTGYNNVAIGTNALNGNSNGYYNVAVGNLALNDNSTGNNNVAIGSRTKSSNYSGSVILGTQAAATGDNQFVVGSTYFNAGAVTTETSGSTQTWSVIINGVPQKILLA